MVHYDKDGVQKYFKFCKKNKKEIKWYAIQCNEIDNKLDSIGFWEISDGFEYEDAINNCGLTEKEKAYARIRWFRKAVSSIDEDIFCSNDNVTKNPNQYDKEYDFKINGIKFDLKSTTPPKNKTFNNTEELVKFYYEEQSKGRRYSLNSRLFFVVMTENNTSGIVPRLMFNEKERVIKRYCENFSENDNIKFGNAVSQVLFMKVFEDFSVKYKVNDNDWKEL